ncbi:methylated-DNA-[protein]-cysteine S-methyltransferase [Inhella inkyongensis]|uniref:methylated-DNA--[protein]-cysteine S-methyltransferase n=1 Tax=Inhella inkyongensis TaxID=392593 RepID=A0A840S356_9BURK|nr:methylated-DNA--[protein]-cysteine S-methyltransferase [Inhella inkyongensis]MBB5204163.1 methylated-DNA-[protein]-cysteine S-methyltransferase [Inhella inkyongensis]
MNRSARTGQFSGQFVGQCRIDTPFGPTLMRRTAAGLAGLWHDEQAHHPGWQTLPDEPDHPWFRHTQALLNHWAGLNADPALPPLDPQGTPFQQRVWALLLQIPRGRWTSYGELARRLGDPKKSRAVGAAVGRNPIGVLIPCHRVLGHDCSLTGYAGGLPMKRQLLDWEGVAYRENSMGSDARQLSLLGTPA